MTANELKSAYLDANPEGHFFDKKTMEHFGDTMGNFWVDTVEEGFILRRKRAVKLGCKGSFQFDNEFQYRGYHDS